MTGNITWETVFGLLVLGGAIAGIWRHWLTSVSRVDRDLQAHKLHVAENFATKAGVSEQMTALTKAVNDVGDRLDKRLDGMTDRLDRVIEASHKPTRRQS